jgi:hypothetical protein
MVAKAKKKRTELRHRNPDHQERPKNAQARGTEGTGGQAQRTTVRRRRQGFQAVMLVLGLPES